MASSRGLFKGSGDAWMKGILESFTSSISMGICKNLEKCLQKDFLKKLERHQGSKPILPPSSLITQTQQDKPTNPPPAKKKNETNPPTPPKKKNETKKNDPSTMKRALLGHQKPPLGEVRLQLRGSETILPPSAAV